MSHVGWKLVTADPRKLNRLMEMLRGTIQEGESFQDFCKALSLRKNKEYALAFSRTAYSERLVLLPQCLRCTAQCQAEEKGAELICKRCGACKAAAIAERAEELGYLGVCMLKGGTAVAKLVERLKPKGVLGVACHFEGVLGVLECERLGIPVQFVALLRDGCADTDVDLDEVLEAMEFRKPC